MKRPLFEMIINDDENSDVEVQAIAFVPNPAIEINFLAFAKEKMFFALDESRRIVSGPAMIADQKIYRKDPDGREYDVFFSKETIEKIALKFFKKDYQKNLNLFHDPNLSLQGVTIFESFVSDESRGVLPMKGFEDLPNGSWFISAKIENDEVWNKIKSGEVKGFSVEGIFSYVKKEKTLDEKLSDFLSGTVGLNVHLSETSLMSFKEEIKKLKEKFLGELPTPDPVQKQAELSLKDGTAVSCTELAPGGAFMVGGVAAAPGEYELSDGTKVVVGEGGVITEVVSAGVPAEPASDYSAQFKEINDKFNSYETKFAEQAQTIQSQTESLQKLSESFNKTNETIVHLVGIVEKMAQSATADPVGASGNNFQTNKTETKEERLRLLADNLRKLKKA